MVRRIHFVAGIHGTGKTSYCEAKKNNDTPHYSCSAIVKTIKQQGPVLPKQSIGIDNNQPALARYINTQIPHDDILLDGHFCLFTPGYDIHTIADDIFTSIPITQITLLQSNPSVISQRLLNRDGVKHPLNRLLALQQQEEQQARRIAFMLNLSLKIVGNNGVAE